MKIAPTTKTVTDYFVSRGWLIIVFAALSYAVWYWPITAADAIQPFEKINFFFECYGLESNTLSDDITNLLEDEGVVEVNLYSYSPEDSNISTYYDKFGEESDFIVVTGSDVQTMFQNATSTSARSLFVPFSDELRSAMTEGFADDYSYYDVLSVPYALKIYDPDDSSYDEQHAFSQLLDFCPESGTCDSYYLLLNEDTPNFSPYGNDDTTGNGVVALNYFLKEYRA
jgi:hypothetical protein